MLDTPIEKVTRDTILGLYQNKVKESRTIDYKRDLPGHKDEDRKEFLADVTSFANASGGYLVFGIAEDAGLPVGTPGISIDDTDKVIQHFENWINTNVEPRLRHVQIRSVDVENGLRCLVIHIPKSWNSPHAVRHNSYYSWYTRYFGGKKPLDIPELKSAFIYGESIAERIRQFRLERIGRVIAQETPVPLHDEIVFIIHSIPLRSMTSPDYVNLHRLTTQSRPSYLTTSGIFQRFNVDGLLIHNTADGTSNKYKQIFRNGIIEYAYALGMKDAGVHFVGKHIEDIVLEEAWASISILKDLDVGPPLSLTLAIAGAKGAFIGTEDQFQFKRFMHAIDRDLVIIPDVIIESFEDELVDVLRPMMDAIWNSGGHQGSFSYDAKGAWNRENNW